MTPTHSRGETLITILILLSILCAVGSFVSHPNLLVEIGESE